MAVTVASLQAVLGLDNSGFNKGLSGASKKLDGFLKDFKSGFTAGLGLGAAELGAKAFGVIASGIAGSIAEAKEAIAVNKQLEQTIKSTGGAAGISAQQARDLASSLEHVTNFGDDTILAGENLLLTFTNIGSTVFPRATETMLDMSQALGQDLKSSAIQLGKALNDPVKGMTALSRVGVTFTAAQKEQIKTMQAAGDLLGAQGIILAELEREFGGSARALADPATQLANAWGNLQEEFGKGILMPILNNLAQAVLPGVQAAVESFSVSIASLSKEELASISETFKNIFATLGQVSGAFNELGKGIVSIAQALGIADKNSTGLGLTFKLLGVVVGALVQPIQLVAGVLQVVGTVLRAVGDSVKFIAGGFQTMSTAHQAMNNAGRESLGVWNSLIAAGRTLWQWVLNIVEGWRLLINMMAQPLNLPTPLIPGSPTPLENGLRGVADAMRTMPSVSSMFGGAIPTAAGAGGTSTTTNLSMGCQSFNFSGDNANEEAISTVIRVLRYKLAGAG